jgi:hypothetical protein
VVDCEIEGGRLTSSRSLAQQPDAARREPGDDLIGPIGGRVGHDNDLDSRRRIIQLELVRQRRADGCLLVPGRDDDRDVRLEGAHGDPAPGAATEQRHSQRIAGVDVDEQHGGDPEERGHHRDATANEWNGTGTGAAGGIAGTGWRASRAATAVSPAVMYHS